MKVIDGNFGQDEANEKPPLERLKEQLAEVKLEGKEDEYLLLWDAGDHLVMLSNFKVPADVMMLLEKAKHAVLMAEFGNPSRDPEAS